MIFFFFFFTHAWARIRGVINETSTDNNKNFDLKPPNALLPNIMTASALKKAFAPDPLGGEYFKL